jgi:hypothetical protein
MNYKFIWVLIIAIFIGCKKETILLPLSDQSMVTEITDLSPIYMNFKSVNNDTVLDLNEKNRIGTTHWIFHIDRRLPLRLVIPEVIHLKDKKANAKMHTNEAAQNYFSYSDTTKKQLAFVSFESIHYTFNTYFATNYILEHASYHRDYQNFIIDVKVDRSIWVDGYAIGSEDLKEYLQDYASFVAQDKKILVYLNVDQNVDFGTYLNLFVKLKSLGSSMQLSDVHFIYDEKKLENCNCRD